MSTTEILEELPKLTSAELETIYRRAVELRQGRTVEATPQLLAAIDEADESFAKEGGVGLSEARRIVASWTVNLRNQRPMGGNADMNLEPAGSWAKKGGRNQANASLVYA